MTKLISYLKSHLYLLPAVILIFLIIFFIIAISTTNFQRNTPPEEIGQVPTQIVSRSDDNLEPNQDASTLPFSILETYPHNNQPVLPGTITISFTTDQPVISADSFSFDIYPNPQSPLIFQNIFPSNKVVTSFNTNEPEGRVYNVVVRSANGTPVYTWNFILSNLPPTTFDPNEEYDINYYDPLFDSIPFESTDFTIDYTEFLTLTVIIKNGDQQLVEQEVEDWIRERGMDPDRYTINYVYEQPTPAP